MVFLNSSLYFVGLFLLDMCVFPFCFFLSLILTHLSTFLGYIQDEVISKEERRSLFTKAQNAFGKEDGNRILKSLVEQAGFQTTTAIKKSAYPSIVEQLEELIDEKALDDYEQSTTQTA